MRKTLFTLIILLSSFLQGCAPALLSMQDITKLQPNERLAMGKIVIQDENSNILDNGTKVCFKTQGIAKEICGKTAYFDTYMKAEESKPYYHYILVPLPIGNTSITSVFLKHPKGGKLQYNFKSGMNFSINSNSDATYFGNIHFILENIKNGMPQLKIIVKENEKEVSTYFRNLEHPNNFNGNYTSNIININNVLSNGKWWITRKVYY